MDSVKEAIRMRLAALLDSSGKRNMDLAEACGVSKSAVSNWLSGSTSIDIERIPAICDFFGVTVDEFLGRPMQVRQKPVELLGDVRELVELYGSITDEGRAQLMIFARGLAATYPKNQVDSAAS